MQLRDRSLSSLRAKMSRRFYDPVQGRFINQDPSGLNGGVNLSNYVQNSVVDGMDPTGLGGVASPGSGEHRIGNHCVGPGPSIGDLASLGLDITQGAALFVPIVGEVDGAVIVARVVDAGADAVEGAEAGEDVAAAAPRFYRYVGEGELGSIKDSGMLRGGDPDKTFLRPRILTTTQKRRSSYH